MTLLHLIRHGTNDSLTQHRIAGRDWELHLNDEGHTQARRRAETMRGVPLAAILCSPLPRCQETAAPLAELHGLPIETRDELIELEFGGWTGRTHDEIRDDERWRAFNSFRAGTAIPGGETLAEARARMLRIAIEVRERYPEGEVAIVGHGDPLRALVMQGLGMSDDSIHRLHLTLDPGQASIQTCHKPLYNTPTCWTDHVLYPGPSTCPTG
ncbi:histidine phosphatase family protein, partial [bacterium]